MNKNLKFKIKNYGFERVYEMVRKIPTGRVMTYGQIGKILNMSPRVVGFALHANKSSLVPCHRVVNRDGRVAPGFAFGGAGAQKERLEKEGVEFIDETNVELKKHLFNFNL